MPTSIFTWPKHPNGKFKSLGDMDKRELVRAESSVLADRRKIDLTTIIVKSFLERQVMISLENLARGVDIG